MVRCRLASNLVKSLDTQIIHLGAFEYSQASIEAGVRPKWIREFIDTSKGTDGIWKVWPHCPDDPKFLEGLWFQYQVRHMKVPKIDEEGKEYDLVYADLRFKRIVA